MINYSKPRSLSFFEFISPGYFIAAFVFFICLFSAQNIRAQGVAGYTFTPTSGTFTALSGATVLTVINGDADDGRYPAAPIGFTFKYDGTNYTQASAVTNGWMSFVTTTTFQFNNGLDGTINANRPFVAPLFDDVDMTLGSVSYLTTGSSPNRVFTMQWLNAKWDYNAAAPGISFQVKLYETTNRVQFIYRQETGALNTNGGTFGASIGLAGTGTGSGQYLSLNNSSAAPTASSTTDTTNISTKPATGQTYTFTPQVVTAAGTTAGGRVTEANGRGIFRALVTLTDSQGNQRVVYTNQQGYYTFEDVAGGQVYVFTAAHRRYMFDQPNQVQFIGEETDGINFIGSPFGIFRNDLWNLPIKKIE